MVVDEPSFLFDVLVDLPRRLDVRLVDMDPRRDHLPDS